MIGGILLSSSSKSFIGLNGSSFSSALKILFIGDEFFVLSEGLVRCFVSEGLVIVFLVCRLFWVGSGCLFGLISICCVVLLLMVCLNFLFCIELRNFCIENLLVSVLCLGLLLVRSFGSNSSDFGVKLCSEAMDLCSCYRLRS